MNEDRTDEVTGPVFPPLPELPPHRGPGRPKKVPGAVTTNMVIEQIYYTGGRIRETCKILGMSLETFYRKYRHHPKVLRALKESRQWGFEQVTDVLLDEALAGDIKAIALYLKYNPVAKDNAWVESQSITLREEKPLDADEKRELVNRLFG